MDKKFQIEWVIIMWEDLPFLGIVLERIKKIGNLLVCRVLHKNGITDMYILEQDIITSKNLNYF